MIYLDNAATTKMSKEVLAEMMPYLTDEYGNAGSIHEMGFNARAAIDKARKRVAKAINAEPSEIIFTSGGSEANSLMVQSFCSYNLDGGRILSSNTEHDSMRRSILEWKYACSISLVGVYGEKDVDLELYDLLSLMYVNNELGFLNPVYEIGNSISSNYFVTDCVQALGSEVIDVRKMNCDALSLSSHKIHGPKGVGALYVKESKRDMISPLIHGGDHQEFGRRGGTENVAGIVGFGKACEMINIDRNKMVISKLRKMFLDGLNFEYRINYDRPDSKIISMTVPGVNAETLVIALSSVGVCISAGSACRSLEEEPSRTLIAAGLTPEEARSTVRISLSCYNTEDEMKEASKLFNKCVGALLST